MGKDFSHSSFSLRVFLCIFFALVLGAVGFAQNIPFNSNVFQDPIVPGDPLHRQLEADIAVDAFASHRLFTVAIDFRNANTTGEAWCSWAFSRNGGRTWENKLFKGDPLDPTGAGHPLFGLKVCGDPVAVGGMVPVSGLDPQGNYRYVGKYFAGGLAFTRGGGAKEKVFVTTLSAPADGSTPSEERTVIVDEGTPSDTGSVLDKPTILFVPPGMPGTPINGGHGVVHFAYSVFDGKKANGRPTTKIMHTRSLDGGITFSNPVKVNNNEKFGNGTAMAVDTKGILYLIWTDHDSPYLNASDIYLVRSSDGGHTWSQAIKLPAANLFDQPQISGNGATSRLPAFASIAAAASPVNQPDKVIVAYQAFVDSSGNQASPINAAGNPVPGVSPRIVVTVSLDNGNTFLTPKAAAWDRWDAYQFFPKLVTGGNWAYLLFMDGRNILPCPAPGQTDCFSRTLDFVSQFGGSFMTGIDRKMHARILQADLVNWAPVSQNPNPLWNPSRRVSQYLINPLTGRIVDRDTLHPGIPADDLLSPSNFSNGRSFIGDYNGLVSAVQYKRKTGNVFGLALEPGDLDARTVNAVFVSTQSIDFPNVGLPNQSNWQVNANWWDYNPALCINIGTRNTDVIFASITPGVVARWSGTSGQIQGDGNPQQEFILHVENTTQRDRFFQIRIIDRPGEEDWSFYQKNDKDQNTIQTQILRKSSISRGVYRHMASLNSSSFVDIEVKEITAINGPAGSIESTDVPPQNVPPLETTLNYRVGPELTPISGDLHKVTSLLQPVRNLPVKSSKKLLPSSVVDYERTQFETTQFETVQYETVQYETTQFETTQFETAQFETTQFETTQFETAPLSGDKDFTLTLKNQGTIATAVNATTTVLNGQGLLTGPTLGLDPNGHDFQLLLYRTYKIPVANVCTYNTPNPNPTGYRMLDLVISNLTVNRPNEAVGFKNHQVANEKFENTQFETTQFETTQYETLPVSDAQLSNASALVDKGETIYYTVRSYKPAGQNGYNPSDPATVAAASLPQQVNPGQDSTADPITRIPIGSVLDATGPAITPRCSINGGPKSECSTGWYKDNVTVSWEVVDPGSGVSSAKLTSSDPAIPGSTTTCSDRSINFETSGITLTCEAANGALVTSSFSITVKVDKTLPTLTFGSQSPAANAVGWNNTNVSFSFTTADNLSGVFSSIPNPLLLTAEGSAVTGSVTVTDVAGNSATSTSPPVKIDKTKPTASADASPAPNGNGWNNTDVTVTFTGSDNGGSGIDSCTSPITLSADGANQSAGPGTCTDKAGNISDPVSKAGINIDKTTPTITIGASSASFTKSGPVTYAVTYADANFNVSTLTVGNIVLNKTGTANGTIVVSPGNGTTRTVTLSNITGDGTLSISITAGTASDLAGNLAPEAGPSNSFTVDNTPPAISIGAPSASSIITNGGPVTYTVTYADANFNVSTLAVGNIVLNKTGTANATVTVSAGNGTTRTVTLSGITGVGTLSISITAGTASDLAGNLAPAAGPSNSFSVVYNVTLASPKTPANNGSSVPLNWTLKDANGVIISDLTSLVLLESIFNGAAPAGGCTTSLSGIVETLYSLPDGGKGGSTLRSVSSGFQFNWDTKSTTTNPTITGNGCYTAKITLKDGTVWKTTPIQLK